MGILRVLLAIAVVIAHSQPALGLALVGGQVAVQAFFIISGFYMALILERKYAGEGGYSLFLGNRFLRLFPIYWIVLVATAIAGVAGLHLFQAGPLQSFHERGGSLGVGAWLLVALGNLAILGQDLVYFLGVDHATGSLGWSSNFMETDPPLFRFLLVPQAWSLSLEICFYLMVPFLAVRSTALLAVLVAASLLCRLYIVSALGLDHDPWLNRLLPLELALFLMGILSFRLYRKMGAAGRFAEVGPVFLVLTLLVVLAYPLLSGFSVHQQIVNWVFYFWLLLALPFIFHVTRQNAIDARLGELSYPLYVVHVLVIYLLAPFLGALQLTAYKGELTIFLSLGAAWLLVKFVADPVERYRQYRVRNHVGDRAKALPGVSA
ncbi:MAG: acyltransferase [Pseudomonadota bacterium]